MICVVIGSRPEAVTREYKREREVGKRVNAFMTIEAISARGMLGDIEASDYQ